MKRNITKEEIAEELNAWLDHIGYRKYCSEITEKEFLELAEWILTQEE